MRDKPEGTCLGGGKDGTCDHILFVEKLENKSEEQNQSRTNVCSGDGVVEITFLSFVRRLDYMVHEWSSLYIRLVPSATLISAAARQSDAIPTLHDRCSGRNQVRRGRTQQAGRVERLPPRLANNHDHLFSYW